jgi:hypothetical protein
MKPLFKPNISEMIHSIKPFGTFTPVKEALTPAGWRVLGEEVLQKIIRTGEEASAKEFPQLPVTLYREFLSDGNRTRFQDRYNGRRLILLDLILAEAAEGKGRFTAKICDGIWRICEETTWVLPAHNIDPAAGEYWTIPQKDTSFVDLFSAETGAFLASALYLLGNKIEEEVPGITGRIVQEIRSRVLIPYMERDDFWWMNFREGNDINNWNPWCNSNILLCLFLLEHDDEKRRKCTEKVMRSLDIFVESYPEDGSCDEGPGYWSRAGASLFECIEYLSIAGLEDYNLFAFPGLRRMGEYICDMRIGGNWFVNFADAPPKIRPLPGLLYRFGKKTGSPRLESLARELASPSETESYRYRFGTPLMRGLAELFSIPGFCKEPAGDSLPVHAWYPDGQVMISRETPSGGLFLAAKGGGNGDSHNHNDVGQFIVFRDLEPVIIDAGVEDYTAKTFSSARYEIWTMRSVYHNLPEIDGNEQLPGSEYRARDVSRGQEAGGEYLSMEISGAYGTEAGIRKWIREFRYSREGAAEITVTDTYTLENDPRTLNWSLLVPKKPEIGEEGEIRIGPAVCRISGIPVDIGTEEIPLRGSRLERIWGEKLYRVILSPEKPPRQGKLILTVK